MHSLISVKKKPVNPAERAKYFTKLFDGILCYDSLVFLEKKFGNPVDIFWFLKDGCIANPTIWNEQNSEQLHKMFIILSVTKPIR